jgi:hypothetical protein
MLRFWNLSVAPHKRKSRGDLSLTIQGRHHIPDRQPLTGLFEKNGSSVLIVLLKGCN